jgi:hypothetical protein
MTTQDVKPLSGRHSETTVPKHAGRPKARDIEAIALSSMHGSLMARRSSWSSVREARNGVVARWVAIVRWLFDFLH